MATEDIDIFRDPVYEEMGLIFDPERNQYYKITDDPQYGPIRTYISPRDQSPVPLLSDARRIGDTQDLLLQEFRGMRQEDKNCLLYTSDAADE